MNHRSSESAAAADHEPRARGVRSSSESTDLKDYRLGETIGRGAAGEVLKALNTKTGATVAVKQISLAAIAASDLPDLMSEIELLQNLDRRSFSRQR